MDLQTLRYFVAVMTEGSIAQAAKRENISPSAVSKRIAEIESLLGVTLFKRTATGLDPTPPAMAMLRHASRVLSDVQIIEEEIADYAKGYKGNIRIASTMSAVCQHLPRELQAFSRAHPGIRFQIDEFNSNEIVESLREKKHDIGFVFWERQEKDIELIPYVVDELVIIAHKDHEIARHDKLFFKDIMAFDLVGMRTGSDLERRLVSEARRHYQQLNLRMRTGAFDATFQLVAAGLGVSVVPKSYLTFFGYSERIHAVAMRDSWAKRQLWLALPKEGYVSEPTRLLVAWIQSRLQRESV